MDMTDTHFIFTNSMNWAIIASSALGVFCQYMDKTHRDDFIKFKQTIDKAQESLDGKSDEINLTTEKALLEDARNINSVSLMKPIILLFGIVSLTVVLNAIGVVLVWFEGEPYVEAIKAKYEIVPFYSYRFPLALVGVGLAFICFWVIISLTIIKRRQNEIATTTIDIQNI